MTKLLTLSESILMLAIWRLKDNAYGVTIRKKITELTNITYSYGTLYSALDQLVRKDYVSKSQGGSTPERGGRSKIYYRLSDDGIMALKKARIIQKAIWDGISDVTLENEEA